jgi:hypothetical protein
MLRTTTHPVSSAHQASFLHDVGKRDVCIVFDFRRYQRDVFELTMHAHASVALDGRDMLVVLDGGAQVVRFAERDLGEPLSIFALTAVVRCIALDLAEARGTNPDRFRSDEDPGRERRSSRSGSERFHRHRRAAGGCQRHVVVLLDDSSIVRIHACWHARKILVRATSEHGPADGAVAATCGASP